MSIQRNVVIESPSDTRQLQIKVPFVLGLSVLDKDLAGPPSAPNELASYIVGPSATGPWSGFDNAITIFSVGDWHFIRPWTGLQAYVEDEGAVRVWSGSSWDLV